MSFRQPTPTIIRSFHFREDAYEFPVESVLEPGQACEQLLIEASRGYLLTTLANTVPQARQTLSYVTQPDGRSIARTTVTIQVSGSLLINGSVTLRDPLGEVVVLPITIEPLLFINSSTLTFIRTEPNEDVFATLEISQRGAHTPVVLSTSDPNRFTLAESGKDLDFSPVLTITPSFRGTSIRVRYAPAWSGRHTAHLVAEAPYATKTVSLQGSAPGLLSWFRLPQRSNLQPSRGTQTRQPATSRARKIGLLAILLLGGLACAGYVYKCKLMPGLCQSQTASESVIPSSDTALVNTRVSSVNMGNERLKNQSSRETRIEKKEGSQVEKQRRSDSPQRIEKVTTGELLVPSDQATLHNQKQRKHRVPLPVKADKSKDESDLEKELNGNVTNKQ